MTMSFKKFVPAIMAVLLASGCTSVSMSDIASANHAKEFNPPREGMSGLYVYREGFLGGALRKDIWVDKVCLGESAPNVFFFTEVKGNETHTIATESEFSPNELTLATEAGKNYFVRQYMKMGVFVGGAGLETVDEAQGKAAVQRLGMALPGNCSRELK